MSVCQETPIISIVIPVYCAKAYLEKCVQSVIQQDYPNWELILVDDGSPDGSATLCDELQSRDARIRVIHKTNGGVSSARNYGINEAKGIFVTFIDSDDWIDPQLCNALLCGLEHKTDFIISGYVSVHLHETQRIEWTEKVRYSVDELKAHFDLPYRLNLLNAPFGKLYLRETIGALRFNDKISLGEDFLFNLSYIERCTNIVFIPCAYYNYNQLNMNSVTKKLRNGDFNQIVQLYVAGKRFKYAGKLPVQYDALEERLCINGINLLQMLYYSDRDGKRISAKRWLANQHFHRSCLGRYDLPFKYRIPKYMCALNFERGLSTFFYGKKMLARCKAKTVTAMR